MQIFERISENEDIYVAITSKKYEYRNKNAKLTDIRHKFKLSH